MQRCMSNLVAVLDISTDRDRDGIGRRPSCTALDVDPSEKFDLVTQLPDVAARLQKLAADHEASFAPAPSQLGGGPGSAGGRGGDVRPERPQ
jgi:hypothetical protein